MATQECTVCCEAYNKSTHMKIACEHACSFEACKACIRKYILGTTADPNCMQCNKAWSDKFLVKHLNASFMRNDYQAHRTELLVQQQLSRLPETMAAAERMKRFRALHTIMRGFRDEKIQAERHLRDLRYSCLHSSKEDRPKYLKNIETAKETVALLDTHIIECRNNMAIIDIWGMVVEEKKEVSKFIMPCGNTDCRGYLSTQYKCDLCEHHTCAKCFEHIGPVKEEGAHTCKPENIESAEFIKKQSKPCPCCGARISKIDGCDQMWCTQCKTGFSWNTGKIEMKLHNPHYYEWRRQNGGLDREPGDMQCGDVLGADMATQIISEFRRHPLADQNPVENIVETIRRCVHISAYNHIPTIPNYEDQRIYYLNKVIDIEELKTHLVRSDKAYAKKQELYTVYSLLVVTFTDIIRRFRSHLATSDPNAVDYTILNEVKTIIDYVNGCFADIGYTYGCISKHVIGYDMSVSKVSLKGHREPTVI